MADQSIPEETAEALARRQGLAAFLRRTERLPGAAQAVRLGALTGLDMLDIAATPAFFEDLAPLFQRRGRAGLLLDLLLAYPEPVFATLPGVALTLTLARAEGRMAEAEAGLAAHAAWPGAGPALFRVSDHIKTLAERHDTAELRLLAGRKYHALTRAPLTGLAEGARALAASVLPGPGLADLLFAARADRAQSRAAWEGGLRQGIAADHLFCDLFGPDQRPGSFDPAWTGTGLADALPAAALRTALGRQARQGGVLLATLHAGHLGMARVLFARTFRGGILFGTRTGGTTHARPTHFSPAGGARAALFAALRGVQDGGALLIAPDAPQGARRLPVTVLGRRFDIGEGTPFLAWESRCPNFFFTCGFDGTRFFPILVRGPEPGARETYAGFCDRWAAFWAQETERLLTGPPQSIAFRRMWSTGLPRAPVVAPVVPPPPLLHLAPDRPAPASPRADRMVRAQLPSPSGPAPARPAPARPDPALPDLALPDLATLDLAANPDSLAELRTRLARLGQEAALLDHLLAPPGAALSSLRGLALALALGGTLGRAAEVAAACDALAGTAPLRFLSLDHLQSQRGGLDRTGTTLLAARKYARFADQPAAGLAEAATRLAAAVLPEPAFEALLPAPGPGPAREAWAAGLRWGVAADHLACDVLFQPRLMPAGLANALVHDLRREVRSLRRFCDALPRDGSGTDAPGLILATFHAGQLGLVRHLFRSAFRDGVTLAAGEGPGAEIGEEMGEDETGDETGDAGGDAGAPGAGPARRARTRTRTRIGTRGGAGGALFATMRHLQAGRTVLMAPDGGQGRARLPVRILGRSIEIGEGASFLIHETRCRAAFFTMTHDGSRLVPHLVPGPVPEPGERYRAFRDRWAAFYAAGITAVLTGPPQAIALRQMWRKFLEAPPQAAPPG